MSSGARGSQESEIKEEITSGTKRSASKASPEQESESVEEPNAKRIREVEKPLKIR